MALSSGRDACPKGGGSMERGVVSGSTGLHGYPATILWEPDKPGALPNDMFGGTRLARLPIGWLRESPHFSARLCPSYRLVEFEHSEGGLHPFPRSHRP
jgi:hypothetical protein